MKRGNPVVGYALLAAVILLLGLVIATVARDISGRDGTVQVAEPGAKLNAQVQKPAAQQPKPKPQQGRIWEGVM